jgi:ATP-dependent DNA helicase 2 subunit 2
MRSLFPPLYALTLFSFLNFFVFLSLQTPSPPPPLLELDPRIASYLSPEAALACAASEEFEALRRAVKLERVGSGTGAGTKRPAGYGVTVEGASAAAREAECGEPPAKKARPAATLAEIAKPLGGAGAGGGGAPMRVGEVDPAGDFRAMMNNRTEDLVDRALAELRLAITNLVDTSLRDLKYARALECLRAMRECCVQDSESPAFNAFLRDLHERYRDTRPAFLAFIAADPAGKVVTTDEDPGADVAPGGGAEWLASGSVDASLAGTGADAGADDDLFEDLE